MLGRPYAFTTMSTPPPPDATVDALPPLEEFRQRLMDKAPEMLPMFDGLIAVMRQVVVEAKLDAERSRSSLGPLLASIAQLRRMIFGRATEKDVAPAQEHQQYIDPAWLAGTITNVDVLPTMGAATSDATGASAKPEDKPKRERKPGLAARFPTIPVVEIDQALPAELQAIVDRGEARVERTGVFTEQLVTPDTTPVIRRVYGVALVNLAGQTQVAIAPAETIVPDGILADETIIAASVAKLLDAIPLHRQTKIWHRHGIDIPRQTLGDAVMAFADLVKPLANAINRQVLQSTVVFTDESWFRTKDPKLRRRCKRVNVWTKVGDGQVSYSYTEDRTHAQAIHVIGTGFTGYLVRDEWQGWAKLTDPTQVGCNAHARRPFARMQEDDPLAATMVALYGELFAVERQANATGLTDDALFALRLKLRTEHSAGIMVRIKDHAERVARERPPSHELHVGANYVINHWDKLTKFLTDGRLPPDNNLAENALRIVALIRKNSLFFGSDDAGHRYADLLTVLHSCRLQDLDPISYLMEIVPKLILNRNGRIIDLTNLTPKAWVASHPKDAPTN